MYLQIGDHTMSFFRQSSLTITTLWYNRRCRLTLKPHGADILFGQQWKEKHCYTLCENKTKCSLSMVSRENSSFRLNGTRWKCIPWHPFRDLHDKGPSFFLWVSTTISRAGNWVLNTCSHETTHPWPDFFNLEIERLVWKRMLICFEC